MIRLNVDDVSLVFGEDSRDLPTILHFGAAIGDGTADQLQVTAAIGRLHSAFDEAPSPSVLPTEADGWSGTPGFEWHAHGVLPAALSLVEATHDGTRAEFFLQESRTGGVLSLQYQLHAGGALEATAVLHNDGPDTLDVSAIRLLVPLPDRAREVQDFTGSWSGERRPQRHDLADGTWLRAGRRGRTGHDAVTLTSVGTHGFGYRSGEIWSTHVGWSGNGETIVERLPEGAGPLSTVIGGGESLLPGEIRLAPGEEYTSPSVYFAWSHDGLDRISKRLHTLVRSFAAHPSGPRPLLLNSWEAVYMNHDERTLLALADAAIDVGVERFVLDDGWFAGRRTDSAGLGDWEVDTTVWPDGLQPLSEAIHARGMEFGLWFEPEMVNPDSELARTHPEWILSDAQGAGRLWRHQLVLNIGEPDCFDYIFQHVDKVVTDAHVDFIKWDHNRDLHEAVDRRSGSAGVHAQTNAFYRMTDMLRDRHPGLEIESCASGGGRIDLGVAQHTQRIWASDTIDPLERQMVQRGTELVLPLELIGTHVGAPQAHTTGRVTSLSFRLTTALFGHSGIESDLNSLTSAELTAFKEWATLYKRFRPLLHSGDVVHADFVPDGASLTGVVDELRGHALFQWAQLVQGRPSADPRTPFPGLDSSREYRVRFHEQIGRARRRGQLDPTWCADLSTGEAKVLSGELLTGPGVPLPALSPAEALVIELEAID